MEAARLSGEWIGWKCSLMMFVNIRGSKGPPPCIDSLIDGVIETGTVGGCHGHAG